MPPTWGCAERPSFQCTAFSPDAQVRSFQGVLSSNATPFGTGLRAVPLSACVSAGTVPQWNCQLGGHVQVTAASPQFLPLDTDSLALPRRPGTQPGHLAGGAVPSC